MSCVVACTFQERTPFSRCAFLNLFMTNDKKVKIEWPVNTNKIDQILTILNNVFANTGTFTKVTAHKILIETAYPLTVDGAITKILELDV